jgi:peptide deformylase
VDVHEQVVVIDTTETKDALQVFINPEILWASEEREVYDEGCLSVPGVYDGVERPARVKVRALDAKGQPSNWKPMACWPSASSTKWIT